MTKLCYAAVGFLVVGEGACAAPRGMPVATAAPVAVASVASVAPPPAVVVEAAPAPPETRCVEGGTMDTWRYSPALSLLKDGRVLVVGGRQHDMSDFLKDASFYDPKAGTFTKTASMREERAMHGAVTLDDGRVLVAGGMAKAVEVFEPKKQKWSTVGSVPSLAGLTVNRLADGRVMLGGGNTFDHGRLDPTVMIYHPVANRWERGTPAPHGWQTELFPLADGRLVAQADPTWEGDVRVDITSVFDPMHNTWTIERPAEWVQPSSAEMAADLHVVLDREGRPRSPLTYTNRTGVVSYDAAHLEWKVVARYQSEHDAHANVLLDEHHVLVIGGLSAPTRAEICPL